MRPLLGLIYTILFFSYIATSAFIVYHLGRYSLSRQAAIFGVALFMTVLVVLLFTNALIFFSLPLDSLVPTYR